MKVLSHAETQNAPTKEPRFVALSAARWILMLHSEVPNNKLVQQINSEVPNNKLVQQINQILHQFDADVKLIHELKGQLSRNIID